MERLAQLNLAERRPNRLKEMSSIPIRRWIGGSSGREPAQRDRGRDGRYRDVGRSAMRAASAASQGRRSSSPSGRGERAPSTEYAGRRALAPNSAAVTGVMSAVTPRGSGARRAKSYRLVSGAASSGDRGNGSSAPEHGPHLARGAGRACSSDPAPDRRPGGPLSRQPQHRLDEVPLARAARDPEEPGHAEDDRSLAALSARRSSASFDSP
jgi:hypothetical protein